MKIHGQPFTVDYSKQIELPRPDGRSLVLTIRPLALAFHRRLRKNGIAPPTPPTRVARDSSGRPIRDERNLAVLVADDQDAAYAESCELYHQRIAILVAVEALRDDPGLQFETSRPAEGTDWCHYADRLHEEFEQAGWSAGDLIHICDEVCRLSNLVDEHMQRSYERFFPPGCEAETS